MMRRWVVGLAVAMLLVGACTSSTDESTTTTAATTVAQPSEEPTVAAPSVDGVDHGSAAPSTYELIELRVDLTADYANPFDQREVALDATFTAPSGRTLTVPGFWDAEGSWRVRTTADIAGAWTYSVTVTDRNGTSEPAYGTIDVSSSDHPGYLRIGRDIDPTYSARYLAFEDGTPWFGRGHADLNMTFGGVAPGGDGLRKMQEMPAAGENYEMWWPSWAYNFIPRSYDEYESSPMRTIDYIVTEAERHGIALVFTIWTHQYLRTGAHAWPDPHWELNGFSQLTDIDGFFVDEEPWAWQQNYYRYIVARWGYSPAIAMWQTITEINGTESYEHTDTWHEKLNSWFQTNDPFRHPTTATGSGNYDWPAGHAVMDVPQVHLYEVFVGDPITDGATVAEWIQRMWHREEKPNWIGEYGFRGLQHYPELSHHATWAAAAAGAAMTPIEWNDGSAYNTFTDEMAEDMARFAAFIEEVPLARIDPSSLTVDVADEPVRGWGIAGQQGGFIWLQDHALEGASLDAQAAGRSVPPLEVTVSGLAVGDWTATPYDTWTGEWLDPVVVDCTGGPCSIPTPGFSKDVAIRLTHGS